MKNESAFPTQMWDEELKEATWLDGGLTKREWFAGLIMWKIARASLTPEPLKLRAQIAVAHADALIAELEKVKANE